jgi:hypothetical protein
MKINTIYGEMKESALDKLDGVIDNENERTYWVEYRIPGNPLIVHRSVDMILKQASVTSVGETGKD